MTSIGRDFPPAVVLEMHIRNSYPNDRVKRTRASLIHPSGKFLSEDRPRIALSGTGCSHKLGVVVNVKGLNLIST